MNAIIELLYKKTTWAGLALAGQGVFEIVQGDFQTGLTKIIAGLGMVFMRDAIRKVEK